MFAKKAVPLHSKSEQLYSCIQQEERIIELGNTLSEDDKRCIKIIYHP